MFLKAKFFLTPELRFDCFQILQKWMISVLQNCIFNIKKNINKNDILTYLCVTQAFVNIIKLKIKNYE